MATNQSKEAATKHLQVALATWRPPISHPVVPSINWSMAEQGTQRVEMAAFSDKRQVTCISTVAVTLDGQFLPF